MQMERLAVRRECDSSYTSPEIRQLSRGAGLAKAEEMIAKTRLATMKEDIRVEIKQVWKRRGRPVGQSKRANILGTKAGNPASIAKSE
jgi:hypothetical protein